MTSSTIEAQTTKKKTVENKNANKKADEKPEQEGLVVEELTEEQFDVDEEAKKEEGKPEEMPAEEKGAEEPVKEEEPEEEIKPKAKRPAVLSPTEEEPDRPAGREEPAPEEEQEEVSTEEAAPAEEEAAMEEEQPAEEAPSKEAVEEMTEEEEKQPEEMPEQEVVQEEVEEAQPEPEPQPELGPDEIMGIDTVDLEDPQGNWLYKRVWWERAEAKYEKIRAAVTSVLEVRTKFFAKRAELDKTVFDPFYLKTGFSQGELKERLTESIAQIEKDIEDRRDVQLLEKLEADKQALEDARKEVEVVVKLDGEVENAIIMLVEQANKMRNYEQQAWQDFKNIARVLDDKKARELFYKVDGAWRNIQELQQYVESNFSTGFDQLVERVVQQVQKVDAMMDLLKQKGIELKQAEEGVEEEQEEIQEAPQGVISRFIITPIKKVFTAIWDLIMWPIRKLMGTTKPSEELPAEEEPIATEVVETEIEEEAPPTPEGERGEPSLPMPSSALQAPPSMPETVSMPKDTQEPMQPGALPSAMPSEIGMPPAVPTPEPAGTPLQEGEVAPPKAEEEEDASVLVAPEGNEQAPAAAPEEEVLEVEEGEPMVEDLDTSLEIEE